MLKQNSRVYQRYPGIVVQKEDAVAIRELVGSKQLEQQVFSTKDQIPLSKYIFLIGLLVTVSPAVLVVLPVLSVIFTDIPYRYLFWIPAPVWIFMWMFVVCCKWPEFLPPYFMLAFPLGLFYLFGLFWRAGMFDLPWYWICVPLYFLVITVPMSIWWVVG
jgi:hypothetical protein